MRTPPKATTASRTPSRSIRRFERFKSGLHIAVTGEATVLKPAPVGRDDEWAMTGRTVWTGPDRGTRHPRGVVWVGLVSPGEGNKKGGSPAGDAALLSGPDQSRYQMLLPTLLMIVLIWPPRKMTAPMTTMAIRARMSAYSARP